MITLTAKITLADGKPYDVNKRNMLSIDVNIVDRSDITMPSVGVISNRGTLRFVDYDGRIDQLVQTNALGESQKCEIYLYDSLAKASAFVGEFYASKWSYNPDNSEVSLTLEDDLIVWQNLEMPALDLSEPKTAYDVFLDITNYIENNYPSRWLFAVDETATNIMNNYIIQNPYFEKGNLWNRLTKICEVCGLHIFKNYFKRVVVSYDFRS
jgi:hypothetical protein